jgi:PAS domain S-box-containing protein
MDTAHRSQQRDQHVLKNSAGALEHETQLRKEAETLNAVARDLHSNLDLQQVLQKVTDIGTKLTLASFGAFFYNTINEQGEAYLLYTLSGAAREDFEKFGLPHNTPLFSPTFSGERIVRLDDVLADPTYGQMDPHRGMPLGHLPVRSYLALPVKSPQGDMIGGLFFGHTEIGVFDEAAERVALGIAEQASLAIENATLYGKARRESDQRARAEKAYYESEGRLDQLIINAPVAIFQKDLAGHYTMANPVACAALGRTEVVGFRDDQLLDTRSAERIRKHDLQVIETRKSLEHEERVQRGVVIQDYLAVKFPLFDSCGEVHGVGGVAVDITERRQALAEVHRTREEVEKQRRLYEAILNSVPDFVYVFDLSHRFSYANETLLEVWGKNWDEAIGRNCLELGYPEWHAAMHDRELDFVISTKQSFKGEVPFTGTHGTRIYEYIFVPVLNSNGEVEAVAGTTRDVTDRKTAEDATRKGHEHYRQLVESLPAAVFTCDALGRVELFNDATSKLFGFVPRVGEDNWAAPMRIYRPDGTPLPWEECPMVRTLRDGKPVLGEEVVIERPDDTRVNVMPHPQPLFDERHKVTGAINMLLDVTEQRRAEGDRALLAAVVSSSDDAIISKTLDGIITSWNLGAERIFGYTAAEALGQSILMVIPSDRHDEELQILARIRRGDRIQHFETKRLTKDGKLFDLSLTVSPIRDSTGRIIGASKVARDITDRLQAAEALRESEERFRTLANNAPVGIFQTNLAGETLFVNDAWCQLAGYGAHEANGSGWIEAVHPDDRQRVIDDWQKACHAGQPSSTEFRFQRPDGSVAWLQGCAEPLRNAEGKMLGYIGTVSDITSRKLAEQALSENEQRITAELAGMKSLHNLNEQLLAAQSLDLALQLVLSSVITMQQADMGSVHLYDPLADKFQIATQQGFDQALLDTLSDSEFAENSACGKALSTGSRVIIEDVERDTEYASLLPFAQQAGYRAIQCTPLRNRNGQLLGVLATHFRQPRRLARRELWMLDLYAHQASAFIEQMQMINSMREADHRKDEFLAMLAHELRNPLAPIRTGLDFLTVQDDEANEAVGIMRNQVEHLVRLVDDLLDVSRIARGKVELRKEVVDIVPLVERAVDAVSWAFKGKDQSLKISLPPAGIHVHADPVRLVQILGNLLNNASKYTPMGGHIELNLTRNDNNVAVEIRDNGIGIERELLPRVFDLFTQSSRALDRAQGGLGIGLTLVRSLVELHQGTVSADSEGVGKGSRFTVKLPISSQTPTPQTSRPRVQTPSRRILVVDDNFGAARVVSLLLKKLGDHQVEMAHDGPTALESITAFQPDLVLLDIGLPGMDGYEVAKTIRANVNAQQPFLVALTGYGQAEDIQASKAAGFDQHLVKPPSVDMLLDLLTHPRLSKPLASQT